MTKGRMPFPACGPFLCALLLCACGDRSRPSAAEEEQLNNAAEMLDAAPNELGEINENEFGEPQRDTDGEEP